MKQVIGGPYGSGIYRATAKGAVEISRMRNDDIHFTFFAYEHRAESTGIYLRPLSGFGWLIELPRYKKPKVGTIRFTASGEPISRMYTREDQEIWSKYAKYIRHPFL